MGVGLERKSKVVGYDLKKGDFSETSENLPQRIVVLGEATTAAQGALVADVQTAITTAQQAANLYGAGSPLHQIAEILRPQNGGGLIGGIPTIFIPQAAAGGAAARTQTVTATGTATAGGTHTVIIAGRNGRNGVAYDVNIASGDTPTVIAGKMRDVINAVTSAPVSATAALGVVTATAKWAGLTSQETTITVNNNGNALGVTYAVAETVAGVGTPSIANALATFGAQWNTIVINGYGTVTAVMDALEAVNGKADNATPTGRYTPIIFKPFIALTGSILDDPSSITEARSTQQTIAICPAPGSAGYSFEAAANMAALFARCAQDTPELDVSGQSYPDMPTPVSIGSMANYDNRDAFLKKGCSTVDLVAGAYQVQDFVTTYHPAGEEPAQFAYCRNLMLDFNIRYTYFGLEQQFMVDHVIAADNEIVQVAKVVKPKTWKQNVTGMFADLVRRALITDAAFSTTSLKVSIGKTNPKRMDTTFSYKRTSVVSISSTEATAGFQFGG